MAVKTYDEFLKWFQGLTPQQQQNFRNMTQNDATIQGYLQQYDKSNTVYTPSTTDKVMQSSQPTGAFWDTWGASNTKQFTGQGVTSAWNYNYNPNLKTNSLQNWSLTFWTNAESVENRTPWYLEQRNNAIANALYNEWKTDENSVRNYLNTFQDFRAYDQLWQDNTVTAIMKRMWTMQNLANQGKSTSGADLNSMLQNEIMNNYNNAKNGYSDLMWWGANYYSNFWDAVNGKLKEAYWISDLNAFKERYPDQYESLVKYLETIEPSRNATDPNERQMLDGKLQAIIGTGVWAGSDISKLKVLESSIMSKFVNPEQVKKDAENVIKLQTEWKKTKEIANQMWISEDQVQQLILLANWLDSKAWEYYQLTDKASKDITEPYDTKIARLEEEKKIALDRANRNVDWLKQDYDTNYERQTKQNQINIDNAHFIASMTWYWFSDWWIRWLQYTNEQAKNILDDLTKNYDRNSQEMADGIADIIRNWQWNNEDLTKACEDALNNAKNVYVSNQLSITQQYWTVWLQAQQQFANNVQSFIDQVQNIYDSWLQRQQTNLTNLINNVANLNALASNNLLLRQQRIEQFQSESMNLNRNQLQSLASQLWMDPNNYQELVNYQAQAVANELNWYVPWAWMYFQQEIQSQLDQWYTPMQAMNNIMNSDDFKAMTQSSGWDNWSMSGWILYNKATWDYQNLNTGSNERWSAWNWVLYNKATWEVKTYNGWTVSTQDDNWNYQRVKLNEQPDVDTWIPSVYWNNVKLAPTVWNMLAQAYNEALAQWVEIKIADSYRSTETQANAYNSGKEWVVAPWSSYHEIWQAFDLSQTGADWMKDNKVVEQALLNAWFTRPNAKERWHWSYWEWKDAFWWKVQDNEAYKLAQAILNWTGKLPWKSSKLYASTIQALDDLITQKFWNWDLSWVDLIRSSVIQEDNLGADERKNIQQIFNSIQNTQQLQSTLEANKDKTWPLISNLSKLNPRDADYASITAQINSMASSIAKWFGESWALTDQDIERVMKAMPNQKLWNKANEVVWKLLQARLYRSLINTLEVNAKAQVNVSQFASDYEKAVNWLNSNWFNTWNDDGWYVSPFTSSWRRISWWRS